MSNSKRETSSVRQPDSLYALNAVYNWDKQGFGKQLQFGCSVCDVDLHRFMFAANANGRSATTLLVSRSAEFVLSEKLDLEGRPMYRADCYRADSGTIHGEKYANNGGLFLICCLRLLSDLGLATPDC